MLGDVAKMVLVVEDEPTLRETLAEALEADGYTVVQAADGRAALTRFRADHPDLVLLDLMLPELSGVEVTRQIRAESSVPISAGCAGSSSTADRSQWTWTSTVRVSPG